MRLALRSSGIGAIVASLNPSLFTRPIEVAQVIGRGAHRLASGGSRNHPLNTGIGWHRVSDHQVTGARLRGQCTRLRHEFSQDAVIRSISLRYAAESAHTTDKAVTWCRWSGRAAGPTVQFVPAAKRAEGDQTRHRPVCLDRACQSAGLVTTRRVAWPFRDRIASCKARMQKRIAVRAASAARRSVQSRAAEAQHRACPFEARAMAGQNPGTSDTPSEDSRETRAIPP